MLLSLVSSASASADELPRVRFDPETGAFSGQLPHLTNFVVDIDVPRTFNRINLVYWSSSVCQQPPRDAKDPYAWFAALPGAAVAWGVNSSALAADVTTRTVSVQLPPLRYSQPYCFAVKLERDWTAADQDGVIGAVDAVIEELLGGSISAAQILTAIRRRIPDASSLIVDQASDPASKNTPLDDVLTKWIGSELPGPIGITASAFDVSLRTIQDRIPKINARALEASLARTFDAPADAPTLKRLGDVLDKYRAAVSQVTAADLKHNRLPTQPAATLTALHDAAHAIDEEATLLAMAGAGCAPADIAALAAASRPARSAFCTSFDAARAPANSIVGEVDKLPIELASFEQAHKDATADARALVATLHAKLATTSKAMSTSTPSYADRAIWYMSGDVGVVMPVFFDGNPDADFALFVAVSLFFEAVYKDTPLSQEDGFGKRFSLIAGFTLTDIKDPASTARGVLDGKGALGGIGFRVTDYLRVGLGAMLLRQKDFNPLSDHESLRLTPYVSASVDVDVVGTIKGFFTKGTAAVK